MDRIKYYEKLINMKSEDRGREAFWDAKAKSFSEKQNMLPDMIPEEVTRFLASNEYLQSDTSVLDIGGGSGRYAIPMAKIASRVTITDISANMLKYAKENVDNSGVKNIDYAKLDIKTADIKTMGWEGKYDLVFANMCPAISSAADLETMMLAANKWCALGRFTEKADNVTSAIREALNIPDSPDPHTDRNFTYAFFNILWLKGYTPRVNYFSEETVSENSTEEIISSYSPKFADVAQEQNQDLAQIIGDMAANDMISVKRKSTLALLLWAVS